VDKNGWIYYKRGLKLNEKDLLDKQRFAYGLSVDDEMRYIKTETDIEKGRHLKFQQYYKGVLIVGSEYFLHYNKTSELLVSHGKVTEGLKISVIPKITSDEALTEALNSIKAEKYAWDDVSWERSIRKETKDSSATYRPKGSIVIMFEDGKYFDKDKAKLTYYYVVKTIKPYGMFGVYVDAQNGKIIKKKDLVHRCINSNITFTSLYNGNQSVSTCKTGIFSRFHTLKREDWNMNIITKKESPFGGFPVFEDLDEVFRSGSFWGANNQQYTSTHWGIERSWTYFRDVFNRNGWDGGGRQARMRVDVSLPNAAYVPNESQVIPVEMLFGDRLMSLDIAGHEFTHGIVDFTSDLNGENESGALNESYADIFGELVERHTTGSTNFIIGNQVPWTSLNVNIGTFVRDLNNPVASCCVVGGNGQPSQPDTYLGARWFTGTDDNGGVHINNGVNNRWFTLLANGGSLNGITVQGIGIDNAAHIAYRTMTVMLGSNSGYVDARNGSIAIASNTFGCESNELLQTVNAWTAVGLPSISGPTLNINGITTVCNDQYPVETTLEACWLPGATYTWSFPSDLNGSTSGTNNKLLNLSGFSSTWGTFTINVTGTLGNITQTASIDVTFTNCQGLKGTDEIELAFKTNTNVPQNQFLVYPNPVKDILNIKIPTDDVEKQYQVQIINILGQIVLTKPINIFSNLLDVHHLNSGLYNIVFRDAQGRILSNSKIQKQ
jgi:bacillolysin